MKLAHGLLHEILDVSCHQGEGLLFLLLLWPLQLRHPLLDLLLDYLVQLLSRERSVLLLRLHERPLQLLILLSLPLNDLVQLLKTLVGFLLLLGRKETRIQLIDHANRLLIVKLAWGYFSPALFRDEVFQLHDPEGLGLNHLFGFPVDPVVSIQFFLQLNYGFISLVEPGGQSDHDVSLLQKQLLVPVYLLFVLVKVHPLLLYLLQL